MLFRFIEEQKTMMPKFMQVTSAEKIHLRGHGKSLSVKKNVCFPLLNEPIPYPSSLFICPIVSG